MAQNIGQPQPQPRPRPGGRRRPARRRAPSSLYVRVVVVNAAILVAAVALLMWTPVTVSDPISLPQSGILVGALIVLVTVDAALVRITFRGLSRLVQRMEALDVLRRRERLPESGGAETRALINGFNTMLDRLEDERRRSTRRSISALEGERRRISRELHDEIGQRLTGIVLQLGKVYDAAPPGVQPHVAAVQDEARVVMDEVGALAWRIRPAVLDDFGLLAALKSLASSLGGLGNARVDTVLPAEVPAMSGETELAVYRIAQEALTNALRHSGADVVTIGIRAGVAALSLQVADDGRGRGDALAEGPGMRGMRERALLIGGRLGIGENPPHGLRVELTVPNGCLEG